MNTVGIYRMQPPHGQGYVVTVSEGAAHTFTLREALEWGARNRYGLVVARPNFGRSDAWRDPSNYSNRY